MRLESAPSLSRSLDDVFEMLLVEVVDVMTSMRFHVLRRLLFEFPLFVLKYEILGRLKLQTRVAQTRRDQPEHIVLFCLSLRDKDLARFFLFFFVFCLFFFLFPASL